MADFTLGTELTSDHGSPTIYYTLTLVSKTRESNSMMSYTFKIHTRMGGTIGTGYSLVGYVGVSSPGYGTVTIKSTSESMSVWKSGYTKDVTVTCRVPSTTGNATQTLWFQVDRDDGSGTGGELNWRSFNVTSSQLLYTPVTAPSTLTASPSIIAPNTPVTINWSGANNGINNTINNYVVYWDTETVSSTSPNISVGTNTSVVFSNLATRGETFQFKVLTQGTAGSSYYSNLSAVQANVKINNLPSITNIIVDNSPIPYNHGNGTSRLFTLEGTSGDEGQSVSYLYSTTNDVNTGISFTNSTVININNVTAGGNITYYFWAYDGIEYSNVATKQFVVNSLPQITDVNITSSPYTFDAKHLTQTFNGSITAVPGSQANHIGEYIWWYSLDEGSGEGIITYTNTITNYNIRSNISNPNTPFALGVSVTDDLQDESEIKWISYNGSSSSDYSQAFITPKDMLAPTNLNVYNSLNYSDTINVVNNAFYRNISATWTPPAISTTNGYFPLDHYDLSINKTFLTNASNTATNISSNNLTVNANTAFTVNLTAVDTLGRSNTISINTKNGSQLRIADAPRITGNIAFATNTYRVYHEYYETNTSMIMRLNGTINSYLDTGLNLKANITVNGTLIQDNIILTKPNNEQYYTATISPSELKTNFEQQLDTAPINQDYNALITFTPYNNFGQEGNPIQATYLFKFVEAPILSGNMAMTIHYYGTDNSQSVVTSSDNKARIMNTGDTLNLQLTNGTSAPVVDYNTDIVKYRIFCCRSDDIIADNAIATLNYNVNIAEQNYTANTPLSVNVTMPQYSMSKFLYFKVDAIDSLNNVSTPLYFPTYVVGSRVQAPTISLMSAGVDDDLHFIGNWQVTNLGGNSFVNGSINYEDYPNLERVGYPPAYTNAIARPVVKIQYADNIDFIDAQITDNLNLQSLATTGFSFSTFQNNPQTFATLNTATVASGFETKNLYIRLLVGFPTATILANDVEAPIGQFKPASGAIIQPSDYGSGTISSYIYAYSNTVLYYFESPTVAYRKHMLGINTKAFSDAKTILLVKDFNEKRYIYLDGADEIDGVPTPHLMKLDLKTGQIDGFLIDGGTWDS